VRRRLVASYLTLAVFVLLALEIPLGVTHARSERRNLASLVERDAVAMTTFAEDSLEGRPGTSYTDLASIVGVYAQRTGGRVVIVRADGRAIVDSSAPGAVPATPRSFASRPELRSALAGNIASGVRHSSTLGTDLLYVAVPVASGGVVHGAVRITYPMSTVQRRNTLYWLVLAAIAAVVLAIVAVIGIWLARSIARPLAQVEKAASRAEAGDLTARAPEGAGPPEVQSLASSFNDMIGRLEQNVRTLEEFVGDASHELRTPLAALRLRLENLEPGLAEGFRDDLEGALAEVERLSGLVDGLLALARADAAASHPQPIDVNSLVAERLDIWSQFAAENDVSLKAEVEPGLAALATGGRLEQVLDNLLSNALRVSPPGSTVRVLGRRAARFAELHVVDEGPGMSAEERAKAFQRFWRGGRRGPGSGLGLAIVERLVTSDGGKAELRPAPGGGIDATVSLPLPAVAGPRSGPRQAPERPPAVA
jgi:signal transduction histidine kinase